MSAADIEVRLGATVMKVVLPQPRIPDTGGANGSNQVTGAEESLTSGVTVFANIGDVDSLVKGIAAVYENAIDAWVADAQAKHAQHMALDEKFRRLAIRDVAIRMLQPREDWEEEYSDCLWFRVVDGELVGEPPSVSHPNSSDWLVRHPDEPDGWMTMDMMIGAEDVLEEGQELVDYYTHFVRLPDVLLPPPDPESD